MQRYGMEKLETFDTASCFERKLPPKRSKRELILRQYGQKPKNMPRLGRYCWYCWNARWSFLLELKHVETVVLDKALIHLLIAFPNKSLRE